MYNFIVRNKKTGIKNIELKAKQKVRRVFQSFPAGHFAL